MGVSLYFKTCPIFMKYAVMVQAHSVAHTSIPVYGFSACSIIPICPISVRENVMTLRVLAQWIVGIPVANSQLAYRCK